MRVRAHVHLLASVRVAGLPIGRLLAVDMGTYRFSSSCIRLNERFEGKVPVIEDQRQWVPNSENIVKYLDRVYPQAPSLAPRDQAEDTLCVRAWSFSTTAVIIYRAPAAPHLCLRAQLCSD